MNKVKIIHCSDFHFDTVFSELPTEKANQRREDLRETFGKIIEEAKLESVDLLLISGDLFDNGSVMYETLTYIKRKFEEIPMVRVFISPGNHDAYSEKSFYKNIDWPKNVYVFKDSMEYVEIEELNTVIYGQAFVKNYERESLLEGFKVIDREKINILILHGDVVKGKTGSNYNPIRYDDLADSGLDYAALGHVHSFSGINKYGNTYWAYSGCPEGRAFDELGSKGIIVGEIGKEYTDLKYKEMCKRQYNILEVDVSNSLNYDDIELNISNILGLHSELDKNTIYNQLRSNLYKIILKGIIEKEFRIDISVITEKLSRMFYYLKVLDNTDIIIDYESLAKQYSLKGIYVKKMLERINNTESEIEKTKLGKALKLGLDALEQKEVKIQ